jgi:hypothetical protein
MDQFSNHPLYRRHNIDSAMSSIWDFYKKKFLSLFIISLVMTLVIQYASTMVNFKELSSITDPMEMLAKIKEFILPIFIISLLSLLFSTILQHYIIYNPLYKENTIFVSVYRSMKYFIPYLIIMVLLGITGTIAMVLGVFVLIIGMFFALLYVLTIYFFILPILMIEGTSIGDTISRTFTLTHRNFWSNIGWVSVFMIILIVVSLILSGIVLLPFTGSFIKTIINPEDASAMADLTTNPIYIILSAVISALTLPLMPIFACTLYFSGKASEEVKQTTDSDNPENQKVRVEDLYAKPYSDNHPDNPDKKD